MRQDPSRPHLVGTGGKENGLKVWDLQRPQEPLFRAKNVRNDWLDLRVPVWERDLQFLPGSQRVVTCTGHGQLGGRGQRPGGRGRDRPAQRAGAAGTEGVGRGGPGAAVPPPPAPGGLRGPRSLPAPAPAGRAPVPQGVPEVAPHLPPAEHTPGLGGPGGAPSPKRGEGRGGGRAVGRPGVHPHPQKRQKKENFGALRGPRTPQDPPPAVQNVQNEGNKRNFGVFGEKFGNFV
ncbi:WD repeat-containing protein 74 [Serinus canaria]|uniref:WD repeat-containing protein 74 n=1 Tax=Serinus canaria TaxID=9135 RepID=UPI0021CCCDEC|nr:WD repeat-containing protein 74 [Serinus canaria]